jgi:hypothetical protein
MVQDIDFEGFGQLSNQDPLDQLSFILGKHQES